MSITGRMFLEKTKQKATKRRTIRPRVVVALLACLVCVMTEALGATEGKKAMAAQGKVLVVGASEQYTDIQTAVDAAKPGDTVLIQDGLYVGKVTISKSGAEGNPITVKAEGSGAKIFGCVVISGNYIRLEGMELYAYRRVTDGEATVLDTDGKTVLASGERAEVRTAEDGHRYILSPDRNRGVWIRGHHIDVIGNRIHSAFSQGISIVALNDTVTSSDITIAHNYLQHVDSGMTMSMVYNLIIENNEIDTLSTYALLSGGNTDSDYFRIFGENVIIRGNYCHGTVRGPHLRESHVDFIQSFTVNRGNAKRILIENNVLTGFVHQGFMVSNTEYEDDFHISDWRVCNNIISGYTAWGAGLGYGNGIKNFVMLNNAFIGDSNAVKEGVPAYYGIGMEGEGGELTVRNNIIMNSGTSYKVNEDSGSVLLASGNNMIYNVTHQYGNETDFYNENPGLVVMENGEFHYQSGSLALAAGIGPDPSMPITEGWFDKKADTDTWNSFDDFSMTQGQRQWYYLYLEGDEREYQTMITGANECFWSATTQDTWKCRLLADRALSSPDKKMVRAWKAPADGVITIRSDLMKFNPKRGTAAAQIKVSDKMIWEKNITAEDDSKEYVDEIVAAVKKDEMVYFILEQGNAFWEQDIALKRGEAKIPEDADGDGVLTAADMVIVAQNLGKTGVGTEQASDWTTIEKADVNKDGRISILDLAAVGKKQK